MKPKKTKEVKKLKSPIKAAKITSVHGELQIVNDEIAHCVILIKSAQHRLEPGQLERQVELQQQVIDAAEAEIAKLRRWYDEAPTDIRNMERKLVKLRKRQAQLRNAKKIEELVRLAKESAELRKELKEKGLDS